MLFNFIPVVGSIIASIPAILLALINLDIFSAV
jgi:predicted PurR-regulated permease PerM